MNIALVMNLAPRKLGSLEDWVVAFCREAAWEGHLVHAFGRAPVLPAFAERLAAFGTTWRDAALLERGWASARLLSKYDVVHLNLVAPRSAIALAAYAATPAKVLFVAHSDHQEPARSSSLRSLGRRMLDQLTFARVHGLAGVSDYVREKERRRFGLPSSRARTLYNGIDFARFRPPLDEPGAHRLLTTAYFQPLKGVHHLIRAFARVRDPRATLTLCGDGPQAPALKRLVEELGLGNRVQFPGLRNDVERLLLHTDVFVHASHHEAFGLALAEAMSCGRAVIAARVGGVPELIEDGKSGLLVAPEDEAGLAAAMERVLADADLRRRLGANARARVVQHFGLRRSAMEHLQWCMEAAPDRAAATSVPTVFAGRPAVTASAMARLPTPHEGVEAPRRTLVLPELDVTVTEEDGR